MIYYVETNVIAIVVGVIMYLHLRRMSSGNETSRLIFNTMLVQMTLFCLSDIAAYAFRGRNYWGVQIANIFYLITMATEVYAWFLYIIVRLELAISLKKCILYTAAPAVLLIVFIALNPLTGFFFTVDADLLYHRGPGVLATWIVEWGYMIAAFVLNLRVVIKAQTSYRKREHSGTLVYILPTAAAAICQMIFYGTTVTQIGMMAALLLVFINAQSSQISRDELTGLNNKHALMGFVDSLSNRPRAVQLTLFMLDADKFKSINDTYGHLMGDQALRDIADVLKHAVGAIHSNRMILYRYAGDEFLIVAQDSTPEQIEQARLNIKEELEKKNRENNEPYTLGLSMGVATGIVADSAAFDELLKSADEEMYLKKGSKRRTS